eukprot:TRINITY_DN52949_c0_g1_i1.p1 TRINITY_DN52949_c0_g1~~TRINITY_DN52949_c0_g1_i1.p1  ORF type:complete len:231 (-),score=46.91 TRINITY_DN52949_c0_g1_i1:216-908(-)
MVYLKGSKHVLDGTSKWQEVTLPGRRESTQDVNACRKDERLSNLAVARGRRDSVSATSTASTLPEISTMSGSDMRDIVLQQSFEIADRDGNGSLNKMEFSVLMRRVAPHLSGKVIEATMRAVDTNRDGTISFEEFSSWLQEDAQAALADSLSEEIGSQKGALKAVFRIFDTDDSGDISGRELKMLLERVCPQVRSKDVNTILGLMDTDHNGTISFQEFVEFLYAEPSTEH